jgi:cytochrome c peroxidase
MLAGRVSAKGPYGWHGESPDLAARLVGGFGLHRWDSPKGKYGNPQLEARAGAIAAFLRKGLVPPPKSDRQLSDLERQGRQVFNNPVVGCTACHAPETEYTDRSSVELPVPARAGFQSEKGARFKTPSLAFVAGTPPYFHNGSVATLEELVYGNDDRMGKTKALSDADKTALIAFLKTL